MVFDMDSEVKAGIDKRNSQEQDFKKLGFQVLLSMFIYTLLFDLIIIIIIIIPGRCLWCCHRDIVTARFHPID